MKTLNLTHAEEDVSFENILQILKNKIISRGDLEHVSVERQLDIIFDLCEFRGGPQKLDQ